MPWVLMPASMCPPDSEPWLISSASELKRDERDINMAFTNKLKKTKKKKGSAALPSMPPLSAPPHLKILWAHACVEAISDEYDFDCPLTAMEPDDLFRKCIVRSGGEGRDGDDAKLAVLIPKKLIAALPDTLDWNSVIVHRKLSISQKDKAKPATLAAAARKVLALSGDGLSAELKGAGPPLVRVKKNADSNKESSEGGSSDGDSAVLLARLTCKRSDDVFDLLGNFFGWKSRGLRHVHRLAYHYVATEALEQEDEEKRVRGQLHFLGDVETVKELVVDSSGTSLVICRFKDSAGIDKGKGEETFVESLDNLERKCDGEKTYMLVPRADAPKKKTVESSSDDDDDDDDEEEEEEENPKRKSTEETHRAMWLSSEWHAISNRVINHICGGAGECSRVRRYFGCMRNTQTGNFTIEIVNAEMEAMKSATRGVRTAQQNKAKQLCWCLAITMAMYRDIYWLHDNEDPDEACQAVANVAAYLRDLLRLSDDELGITSPDSTGASSSSSSSENLSSSRIALYDYLAMVEKEFKTIEDCKFSWKPRKNRSDSGKGKAPAAGGGAKAKGRAAGAGASASVPKDWAEAQDPNTGKTYYYNRKTSETTWSRPEAPPMPKDWAEAQDPNTGKTYYYNRKTSETTWSRPEAPPEKPKKKKKDSDALERMTYEQLEALVESSGGGGMRKKARVRATK
ncbi:WW domain-containing protein [Pseudoscourfieldia marina]